MRCDGGGGGRHRGGTGVTYEVDVLTDSQLSFRAEGITRPTGFGTAGALAGAIGEITFTETDGLLRSAPQYGLCEVGPVHIEMNSPGGGGIGHAFYRDIDLVIRDVRDGLVSIHAAASVYGVVMAPDGKSADAAATAEARRRLRYAIASTRSAMA
jgi:N-methylhydantoinase B